MEDPMEKRCQLRTLNEMITCKICHGYLIDATTVTECLHTFCKSCIVKHLEDANTCPECEDLIHQSHPLDYIAFDRTMQDLVYKIVPELEKGEYDRERKFYAERGLPCPKDQLAEENEDIDHAEEEEESRTPDANTNMDFHRFDAGQLAPRVLRRRSQGGRDLPAQGPQAEVCPLLLPRHRHPHEEVHRQEAAELGGALQRHRDHL